MYLTGFCELILHSNGFDKTKIPFRIEVAGQLSTTNQPDSIGSSAAYMGSGLSPVALIVTVGSLIAGTLLALLMAIYLKKRKRVVPGMI